jgi:lysyl-tRNA synthetase, class I
MYGKDHSTNTPIYDRICEILGERAPEHFTYELFLDDQGQKISKSKGNGLSIDEWLTYSATESLSYFMYLKPKTAKRLWWDVIPKAVDEYHQQLRAYPDQPVDQQLANPVWHIHGGHPPAVEDGRPLRHAPEPRQRLGGRGQGPALGLHPPLRARRLARGQPRPRRGGGLRGALLPRLREAREGLPPARRPGARGDGGSARPAQGWDGPLEAEALQSMVFAVGKEHGFEPLRDWFKALYEVLLGASQGPRFGGFIALYGIDESIALIDAALGGSFVVVLIDGFRIGAPGDHHAPIRRAIALGFSA